MTPHIHHAPAAQDIRTTMMDGLALFYHRPSGATHLLSSPMPEMLALLAEAPADAATLAERLCAQLDLPCDDEARQVVETRLAELSGIGLVRSI